MSLAPYANDHRSLNGPGDARPTALKIIRDQALDDALKGKTYVVTGGNTGIGYEAARALHVTGADVYVTTRSQEKGEDAVKRLTSDGRPGKVDYVQVELDSLESVRAGAKELELVRKTGGSINGLICNAAQFGSNHLGHFTLFLGLTSSLLETATADFSSRVVMLTSSGHRLAPLDLDDYNLSKGYNPGKAYAHSKVANIYMSSEIERRYGSAHLHANAVHPGMVTTDIVRHLDEATATAFSTFPGAQQRAKAPPQGAATSVWAAVAKELEGVGGKYLEDVSVSEPAKMPHPIESPLGYAAYAFNEANEKRLWADSLAMVGEEDS